MTDSDVTARTAIENAARLLSRQERELNKIYGGINREETYALAHAWTELATVILQSEFQADTWGGN